MKKPLYENFLGTWVLDPKSCQYEQGQAPLSAHHIIMKQGNELIFHLSSVGADGTKKEADLQGTPDGEPAPFQGGGLIDALSITSISKRELRTSAFKNGRELMTVQRQLDETMMAMRVVQKVRFQNGTDVVDIGIYRRIDFIH